MPGAILCLDLQQIPAFFGIVQVDPQISAHGKDRNSEAWMSSNLWDLAQRKSVEKHSRPAGRVPRSPSSCSCCFEGIPGKQA